MKLLISADPATETPVTTYSPDPAFQHHAECSADLLASAESVFEFLDSHKNISAHMEQRNMAMLGGTMTTVIDSWDGKAVGSVIGMTGRILGIPIAFSERIIQRNPPFAKTWETFGTTQLVAIGDYRMGFRVDPTIDGCHLIVFIDYRAPSTLLGKLLFLLIAPVYVSWCLNRILDTTRTAFPNGPGAVLKSSRGQP